MDFEPMIKEEACGAPIYNACPEFALSLNALTSAPDSVIKTCDAQQGAQRL
jgi:hypothetical protein